MPDATDAPIEAQDDTLTGKAREQIGAAKEGAQHAFEASRDNARVAALRTADSIEQNPLAVLVGGLAVGVIAAAAIPRSQRERELLAPLGTRIAAIVAAAFAAAKEQGQRELEARGLTRDGLKDQAKSLFDGLSQAASTAGNAAASAAKDRAKAN